MVTNSLPISPGIDGLPTNTIPDDPTQFVSWFKSVGIKRWFANADVRNSDSNYPITVTGTNSTNATVALSSAATALISAIESIANDTVVGNVSGSTGVPGALTETQLTALVKTFTTALSGAVPAPNTVNGYFLRDDGTWDAPSAAVTTADSIQGTGTAGAPVELVNDAASPGNSFYYGTNGSGTKGWYAVAAGAGGANPTASVGLTAVNGSATTFLRSDGAPALSQAIAPTMTGAWIFTPSSAVAAMTVNAAASNYGLVINGNSAAGDSFGLQMKVGTGSASEYVIRVTNQGFTSTYFTVMGDGSGTLGFNGVSGAAITYSAAGAVTFNNAALSAGTGGVGYTTGAGGTATQITSRTTGVTINKTTGAITLVSAVGSATPATFTVTNSQVAATDVIVLNQKSGTNLYNLLVTAVAAGSFNVTVFTTGGVTTEAPTINFAVIKGVTS